MDLRVVGLRIKTGTAETGTENCRREPCEPHPEECKCSPGSDGAGRELYGNNSYAQIRGGELAELNIE